MDEMLALALEMGGLLIVVAVLAQGTIAVLAAGRRVLQDRERHLRDMELLANRIEGARRVRLAGEEAAWSWQGFRKFEVARKIDEGGDICSLHIRSHDGRPLPAFKPGQFLTLKLRIPGERKPSTRCYSLSALAHETDYRVSVKRIRTPPDAPGAPPGKASGYLHDHIEEGDILDVKAPAGNFCLDVTQTTPIVLVGGGIGITPVLCMLEAVLAHGVKREVWFFYGVRNSREHIMKADLEAAAAGFDGLNLQICYSRPLEGDVKGRDYDHAGWVSVDLFKRVLPSSNYEFYVCGPPPMMASLIEGLSQWGVPPQCVHHEAFGPASVKQAQPAASGDAPPVRVMFQKSGKEVEWHAGDGSLLECAERSGISIDAGCRAGNCGTCMTAVRSGEVQYLNQPGEMPEPGSCLVCVGVPRTDLVLDV